MKRVSVSTKKGECLVNKKNNISYISSKIKQLSFDVMEHTPLAVVITDMEGTIEYVNPYFSKITGYSFEEAVGQNPRIMKSDKTRMGRHTI